MLMVEEWMKSSFEVECRSLARIGERRRLGVIAPD